MALFTDFSVINEFAVHATEFSLCDEMLSLTWGYAERSTPADSHGRFSRTLGKHRPSYHCGWSGRATAHGAGSHLVDGPGGHLRELPDAARVSGSGRAACIWRQAADDRCQSLESIGHARRGISGVFLWEFAKWAGSPPRQPDYWWPTLDRDPNGLSAPNGLPASRSAASPVNRSCSARRRWESSPFSAAPN